MDLERPQNNASRWDPENQFTVRRLSKWLKAAVVDLVFPGIPVILIVTTLALAVGQLRPIRRLQGAWEIGDLAFYLFFAAVGG